MKIDWTICPQNTPTVMRNCSHCGCQQEFVCGNSFRINAQKKKLDIWLIYKCTVCGCTWNMTLFSRVSPVAIEKSLYDGFINNDSGLAFRYAFDASLLAKNNASACKGSIRYSVSGDELVLSGAASHYVTLNIKNPYNINIRLDRVLSEKLGVSRNAVKTLFELESVSIDDSGCKSKSPKLRTQGCVCLRINAQVVNKVLNCKT